MYSILELMKICHYNLPFNNFFILLNILYEKHRTRKQYKAQLVSKYTPTGTMYNIWFFVVFTPSSLSHYDSVWFLPVISLLLSNTVSPVRACLIIWWERFRGAQKEDGRGPLSIQSSLIYTTQYTYTVHANWYIHIILWIYDVNVNKHH